VPPQRLAACRTIVVGIGAIGRQVATQLAAIGISKLTLFDDDHVSAENLAPQAYWPADLGAPKVDATAKLCQSIHPQVDVQLHAQRFRRSDARAIGSSPDHPSVLFACVDCIRTRELIWQAVRPRVNLFVDGRMSGEVIRVLAIDRPVQDEYYAGTLFDPAHAHQSSCTARSTVYTASIAAGLMLGQFTRWLRGLPLDRDVLLNLLSSELTVQ
jgi:molybdopterin-synthase adenylyltransferase